MNYPITLCKSLEGTSIHGALIHNRLLRLGRFRVLGSLMVVKSLLKLALIIAGLTRERKVICVTLQMIVHSVLILLFLRTMRANKEAIFISIIGIRHCL
jgi:hypothetical protein